MSRTPTQLVVTAKDVEEAERLVKAGADALVIGDEQYALRPAGYFSREMIMETVPIAHGQGAKVYVLVNALLHNEDIVGLEDYIEFLKKAGVDGVVYGDPAVLVTVKRLAPQMELHWNTEMTVTNSTTANFWGRKGATRAILARELNLDEVLEFKRNSQIEVQVQVHGMSCIFHSKRELLTSYYSHQGKNLEKEDHSMVRNLFLKEETRDDTRYPLYEDTKGTHMMSPADICMIEWIDLVLEGGIDAVKIEGLMKSTEYNEKVVAIYRKAIDSYYANPEEFTVDLTWKVEIEAIQPPLRPLDTGFFFKEQIF